MSESSGYVSNPKLASEQPPFHVVFIATTTDEKIRDLNIVAKEKRLPLRFYSLGDLVGTLHNTLEDGNSAEENATKKLKGIKGRIEECRKDPVAVEEFCRTRGITNFDIERVWFGTEDSGVNMPPVIWNNIPKSIFSLLPEEVLERLHQQGNIGPGVETAPFLSATLGVGNIAYIVQAGLSAFKATLKPKEKLPPLVCNEKSALILESMKLYDLQSDDWDVLTRVKPQYDESGQPNQAPKTIKAVGVMNNFLAQTPYANPELTNYGSYKHIQPLPSTLGRKTGTHLPADKTAAELGAQYIARYSARARAVEDLAKKINRHVDFEHGLLPLKREDAHELVTDVAAHPEQFNVGIVNAGEKGFGQIKKALFEQSKMKTRNGWEESHLHARAHDMFSVPNKELNDYEKAYHYLAAPERLLKANDGIILMPDSKSDKPMTLDEKLYVLSSIAVAKQLITRDKRKPVIIINTDGSWTKAMKIHADLASTGMTKDHALPLSHKFREKKESEDYPGFDVESHANAYFHTINGTDDVYEGMDAASYLMKEESLSYHRVQEKPFKTSKEGDSPFSKTLSKYIRCDNGEDILQHDEDYYDTQKMKNPRRNLVAIFCSASSENAPLNKFVSDLTFNLAESGRGVICGGGDRYTMGAILDGVKRFRETFTGKTVEALRKIAYIAGISTYQIAASETDKGVMPEDYSYRELTADIYERMVKMLLPARTVIVAPGGAGTVQEWMGFKLLKEKMPKLFKDKKLIIFDPDLMTNPGLKITEYEQTTKSTALQNKVFDGVLRTLHDDDTLKSLRHAPRLARPKWVDPDTYVVGSVKSALDACEHGRGLI